MREGIHPKYETTSVVCACGEKFDVGSTKQNIRVEVCSKCHPFYTGNKARVLDTAGRVEKFNRRFGR